MAKEKSSRVSVTMPLSTKTTIEKLAAKKGVSMSAFLQEMVERELFIEAAIENGDEFIIRSKDGKEYVIAGPDYEVRPRGIMANLKKFLSG
jgi:hypothetical protein